MALTLKTVHLTDLAKFKEHSAKTIRKTECSVARLVTKLNFIRGYFTLFHMFRANWPAYLKRLDKVQKFNGLK